MTSEDHEHLFSNQESELSDSCASCNHHHHDEITEQTSGYRLLLTLILNLIIPSVQIIGGLYAGSVALISDAVHNFSDFTAILIAYFAYIIGKKGASIYNTFGYRRSEVLASLLNVVILTGASAFIIYEAVHRFQNLVPVSGKLVIWVAGIGVIGNGFSAWLLHRDSKHSLNIRGAFLHMIGDFLTSVAVLINGVVILFKPWYWLDPLLSFFIVIFILKNCWSVSKEAIRILMNATPKHIDIAKIKAFLEQFPDIHGVHYLHAWNSSSVSVAFSAHIVITDRLLSETEQLAQKIRKDLFHHFRIDHIVLQFETESCGKGTLLCEVSCGGAEVNRNIKENY
ncbi:MAG: cation transporter [Desulfobacterales bacterium]|nr:cation transporter [Desulfobacterales bacterium]